MKIAIISSGYMGSVSWACFADFGHGLMCVDKDQGRLRPLNAGVIAICKPGMAAFANGKVDAGWLNYLDQPLIAGQ